MPNALDAAELDAMLDAVPGGSTVVFNGQTVTGLLTSTQTPLQDPTTGAIIQYRTTELQIRDGALTGLAIESILTVDGVSYRVRDVGSAAPNGLKPIELAPVKG